MDRCCWCGLSGVIAGPPRGVEEYKLPCSALIVVLFRVIATSISKRSALRAAAASVHKRK